VLAYHRQHAFPGVVARFFNTVGPRQVGTWGMVIPRFVEAALAGRDIEVYGDGKQSRCFCHVRDVVEVLPRLLDDPDCHGRVFNVGSDESVTILDLARLVVQVTGSTSRIVLKAYDQAYPEGFEDLRERRPDLTKIRQAAAFEPRIGLRETIADAVRARREQSPGSGAGAPGTLNIGASPGIRAPGAA
jgi:UDP-glucose 4-epimerase